MKKLLLTIALTFIAIPVFAEATPTPTPGIDWGKINNNLQTALADVLQKTVNAAEEAKTFIIDQLPDVLKQLLRWKFVESLVRDCVALVALSVAYLLIKSWFSFWKSKKWTDTFLVSKEDSGIAIFLSGMVLVVLETGALIIFFSYLNLAWLQIWVAPKVYLIEYVKHLVH